MAKSGKQPPQKPSPNRSFLDDILWEIPFARPTWNFFIQEGKAVRNGWLAFAFFVVIAFWGGCHYASNQRAEKISELKGHLSEAERDRDKYQIMLAPFEAMAIAKYTNAPMEQRLDLLGSSLSEISMNLQNILSNVPTLQIFYNSLVPHSTNEIDVTNNHVITRNFQINAAQSMEGLNPGSKIDLKSARDISLGLGVFGKKSADHVVIQLLTPWMENSNNITADLGWMDAGQMAFLIPDTKTYSKAHAMRLDFSMPLPPNAFYTMPTLHIPPNYAGNVVLVKFRISANDAQENDVGVEFDCK